MEHLKQVFLQKESADTFCHPKMKCLIRYDKKHNSELAYTLYIYLLHEQNISKTAAEMHMHRNSVIYRIRKIQSLIGEDFGDHFERQYQILSYRMMCNQ